MRKSFRTKLDYIILMIVAVMLSVSLILSACSKNPQTDTKNTTVITENYKPVTLQNYNRELTFQNSPKRVVSLYPHCTEILLALGLENKIVGTAHEDHFREVLPEYKDKYSKIPLLAKKGPSKEILLSAEPDFIYSTAWDLGGPDGLNLQELSNYKIRTYIAMPTYIKGATMADVYSEIENLGNIFLVQSQAKKLISSMQLRIEAVRDKIGKIDKPVQVLVFDQGSDILITGGKGLESDLIKLAGGENVFDDINKEFARVSWEEAAKRNPEVIIVHDYDLPPSKEKIIFIKNHPVLGKLEAVKKDRIVIIPLENIFHGVRNPTTVETLAKAFYPEKFE